MREKDFYTPNDIYYREFIFRHFSETPKVLPETAVNIGRKQF